MSESNTIGELLHILTEGKPYVFVIMSYNEKFELYERLQGLAQQLGLMCLRADDVPGSGTELLSKIHHLIERADVVVAEISTKSPNVFYEIGYSVAVGKPPLLLIQGDEDVPTDLKGREVIRYSGSRQGTATFHQELIQHLRAYVNRARTGLLRDLLIPESPEPAYIAASPKYPTMSSRILGQVYDRRTFSDNIGILGLITAFGSVLGVGRQIELVSAGHLPPKFLLDPEHPRNIYWIGSKKVNKEGGELLDKIQPGSEIRWALEAESPDEEQEQEDGTPSDWRVRLYRYSSGERHEITGETETITMSVGKDGLIHTVDHGIIVRAPHPLFPDRIVMVMAVAHSLGTAAACMAATGTTFIQRIRDLLPATFDLADKSQPFWVLVRGEASQEDKLLDESGVTILEAGVYN